MFSLSPHRMYVNHHSQTMRGILKRKFADVDETLCYSSPSPPSSLSSAGSSEWESDGDSNPSDDQDFTPHSPPPVATLPSKSPKPCLPSPHLCFTIIQTSSLSIHFFLASYRSVSYQPAAALLMKTLTPGQFLIMHSP